MFKKKDWPLKKIGEFAELKTGGTPSRSVAEYWGGDIKWMSSGEIWGKMITDTTEKITELAIQKSAAKILPAGSVMVALNGQGKTRGTVALLCAEMTCNQSLAAIIPNEYFDSKYLYYVLDRDYSQLRNLTGDKGRNGLNLGLLRGYEVPFPPLDEQRKIAELLHSVDDFILKSETEIDGYRRFKQALLADLV